MKVLVACEFSGTVRKAFEQEGHDAWSCDIIPSWDTSTKHHLCDVKDILNEGWDLMIAHPPCTYLSVSGLHWNKRRPERIPKTEEALKFVHLLMNAPIEKIAIENPVSCISTRIRKPDQTIQPYEYGEDISKRVCLWLKNLAPLKKTGPFIAARVVQEGEWKGKERWSNQTNCGRNKMGPRKNRGRLKSVFFPGIAKAMAKQWGSAGDAGSIIT